MDHKQPSSLDYASLLHELTLKKWIKSILNEDWQRAEAAAGKMAEATDRFWRWLGLIDLSLTWLFRGRSESALAQLEEAAHAYPESESFSGSARNLAADIFIEAGEWKHALAQARKSLRGKGDDLPAQQAFFYLSLAQFKLGHLAEAEKACAELRRHADIMKSEALEARYHLLRAKLALATGKAEEAIRAIDRAQSFLPPKTPERSPGPTLHVPVWFCGASAYLALGGRSGAAEQFSRIANASPLHLDWPIPYVRSFYFLGKIHQERGDMERAREHYRRFVGYWEGGDLDRHRVEESLVVLSS